MAAPRHESTASPEEIRAFFAGQGRSVLTFVGFSTGGYEDPEAMLAAAGRVLDRFDPERTLVNIGATAAGIGAVYELARRRGFPTTGIVSTRARERGTPISPFVDRVFYVEDETWGGRLEGSGELSPTSRAMVEASDHLVAIGGGEVARDELEVARRLGIPTEVLPAEMSHRAAREKARAAGEPPPEDFRGAVEKASG